MESPTLPMEEKYPYLSVTVHAPVGWWTIMALGRGVLPLRTNPFIWGWIPQSIWVKTIRGKNLDNGSRQNWRENVCCNRIKNIKLGWYHDLFSRKSVDVHFCPGLLTFASSTILILLLSDGIKEVSAITVAGTVLELNELPCRKKCFKNDREFTLIFSH